MAPSARYTAWDKAGRPYRLAPWVVTAKRQAKAHGVRWLGDLGNEDHLTDPRPEDHTPFSVTAWPWPLTEYVVLAEDFARGPYCEAVLALCRAGDPRVRWIKYMNFGGHHYNVKRGWRQERSSDEHWHISGRSDHVWTDIEPGFDLFAPTAAPTKQGGKDMRVLQLNQPNGKGGTDSSWWSTDTLRAKQLTHWEGFGGVLWHCEMFGQGPYDYQSSDLDDFWSAAGRQDNRVDPDPAGVNIAPAEVPE